MEFNSSIKQCTHNDMILIHLPNVSRLLSISVFVLLMQQACLIICHLDLLYFKKCQVTEKKICTVKKPGAYCYSIYYGLSTLLINLLSICISYLFRQFITEPTTSTDRTSEISFRKSLSFIAVPVSLMKQVVILRSSRLCNNALLFDRWCRRV